MKSSLELTKYHGVYIQHESTEYKDHYWIIDSNGNDLYCGQDKPNEKQIDKYVSYYK